MCLMLWFTIIFSGEDNDAMDLSARGKKEDKEERTEMGEHDDLPSLLHTLWKD